MSEGIRQSQNMIGVLDKVDRRLLSQEDSASNLTLEDISELIADLLIKWDIEQSRSVED